MSIGPAACGTSSIVNFSVAGLGGNLCKLILKNQPFLKHQCAHDYAFVLDIGQMFGHYKYVNGNRKKGIIKLKGAS
jgi:hypothetical protein